MIPPLCLTQSILESPFTISSKQTNKKASQSTQPTLALESLLPETPAKAEGGKSGSWRAEPPPASSLKSPPSSLPHSPPQVQTSSHRPVPKSLPPLRERGRGSGELGGVSHLSSEGRRQAAATTRWRFQAGGGGGRGAGREGRDVPAEMPKYLGEREEMKTQWDLG